ncbi:MAG: hypothetical protein Q4B58_01850 [Bacteroidales bacterium]|nr:hypothetical protein [Bacteroidales bacterium]
MNRHWPLFCALLSGFAVSCSKHPQVPKVFETTSIEVNILPDYKEITIPCNIAPLNFCVEGDSIDQCVACVIYPGGKMLAGGERMVSFDPKEWHHMLMASKNDSIKVQVYTHTATGWYEHPIYGMFVSADEIDKYISYRLIPPYNTYEHISLCQRDLTTAEEFEFYNNQMLDDPQGGHCVNCHAFQNFCTEKMQFHVREEFAGTMVKVGNTIQKYDLKVPSTVSGGVYPAWHPSMNLIAYSINKSFLENHTYGSCKSEVQDSQSGLMLFDVEHERVIPICDEPNLFETFPTWSPDGEWLYYNCATFEFHDADPFDPEQRIRRQMEVTSRYKEIKYNVYRRKFDSKTLSFGEPELVLDAEAEDMSATLPRISVDGRYLLTCVGNYGCFHIYHPEADLWVTNLALLSDSIEQRTIASENSYSLREANSLWAESYHNWSSNGRWIVFQSRRRDNNYTRLYFSYFDRNGKAHKAFELPHLNPELECLRMVSYNIPEFTVEPIEKAPADWAEVIWKQKAKKVRE